MGARQEHGLGCRIIAHAFDDTWHEIREGKDGQADAKAQDTRQIHALINKRSQNLFVPWWRQQLAFVFRRRLEFDLFELECQMWKVLIPIRGCVLPLHDELALKG